jgi:hypothetical protein
VELVVSDDEVVLLGELAALEALFVPPAVLDVPLVAVSELVVALVTLPVPDVPEFEDASAAPVLGIVLLVPADDEVLVSAGADVEDDMLVSELLAVLLLRCAQPMPVAAAAATATSARRCVSLFIEDSFDVVRRCSRCGRVRASCGPTSPWRQASTATAMPRAGRRGTSMRFGYGSGLASNRRARMQKRFAHAGRLVTAVTNRPAGRRGRAADGAGAQRQ